VARTTRAYRLGSPLAVSDRAAPPSVGPRHGPVTPTDLTMAGPCFCVSADKTYAIRGLTFGRTALPECYIISTSTAKVRSMTDEQLAAMHGLLAEYHRKLAKEAVLDVVQQYHAGLAQRLADEAVLIPRRTAIVGRLHEREQQIAEDGSENE
jgi:hypothetical protein